MRRAKIVATMAPATSRPGTVRALVEAGMDVARLNMSHGSDEEQAASLRSVRAAGAATGRGVGVLVDLQGPKIRLGRFAGGPVSLVAGDEFTITTDEVQGDSALVSTTHAGLPQDVRPGDPISIRYVDPWGRTLLDVPAVEGVTFTPASPDVGTEGGGKPAIVPSIEGWARVTGLNTIFIADRDPYAHGFLLV